MAHDASVGYWAGDVDASVDPDLGHSLNELDYLSPARRHQLLLGELLGVFKVEGTLGLARLSVDAKKICTIARPDTPVFRDQMKYVRGYADLRTDRHAEIMIQQDDILSDFGAIVHLNASRRKYTVELLGLVQALCVYLEMQIKHLCRAPRPVDYDARVQPMIQTPDHSTYPSGHAIEAFAIAGILNALSAHAGAPTALLDHRALRISANRVVAGVHFPIDNAAGAILGRQIARAVLALSDGSAMSDAQFGTKGGVMLDGGADLTVAWLRGLTPPTATHTAPKLGRIAALMDQAKREWPPQQTGGAD